jgi:hypothetical protein
MPRAIIGAAASAACRVLAGPASADREVTRGLVADPRISDGLLQAHAARVAKW